MKQLRGRSSIFLVAAAVLPLVPAAMIAQTSRPGSPGGRAETVLLPPQFRLTHYETGSFVQRRRNYSAHVVDARNSEPPDVHGERVQGAAEIRALLELAEFDLAHGLAAEGLSVLNGLDEGLLPNTDLRRAALELGLSVMDSRKPALSESAQALLDPRYELWRDQAVLAALHHWQVGDMEMAAKYVDVAAKRLYQYSRDFNRRALPPLLDIAVETRQWRAARRLAGRFAVDPELAGSTAYLFQLARTAEAGDDLLAAFDNYLKAGTGNDLWAHRARVALIELGLRTETLSLQDARVLLAQASRAWGGDDYGLAVMKRLAEVDLKLGDTLAALLDYASIMVRYPASPDLPLVRQKARSLWTDFYERGAAGRMSLSAFLQGHRRIADGYRFEPGFDALTEALADRFMAAGATMVAADEYRETHDFLLVSRDLGLTQTEDRRLDQLRLKQAEALYKGGQLDELAYLVTEGLRSEDKGLQDELNLIKARLYAEQGDPDDVVKTEVSEPTIHFLRLQAAARFGQRDWGEAKRLYGLILDRTRGTESEEDAVRMLLAAHRSGDRKTALEVAKRFEELTHNPKWARIALSITDQEPALLPLRADNAQKRVEAAAQTLENLEELKAPGN